MPGRSAEPPWATVLATTLKLWAQRRLRPRVRRSWPVLALVAIAAGAAAIAVYLIPGANSTTPSRRGTGGRPGSTALTTAAAARRQVAAWVASQVSGDAILSCDPAMCAALQAHHIPAGRLLVLQLGQADPLGSDIVVATPAVRSQFGARLATVYAPVSLAAFGSGAEQITVRVVATDGAAAYRTALASDVRDRRIAGAQLARNPALHAHPAARAQLMAGRVDSRLLVTLAALAGLHPVDIVSFGGLPARGASAGLPVRAVTITPATPRAAGETLQALRQFLVAQRPPYRPSALTMVRLAPGRTALRVEFAAPSPLGLLGSRR